ncbi:hypothetical protein SAMN05421824_1424 [Hyunsoonleella jejuensis]|uniref:Uncharacterized protein n=1 Tax=Hyunsoonleella jejuensis TaxID=419940 RepID=A0A1H9FAQ9_9FLAO|nr:hypothetical protein [Hyunsoonleella jejuensis]SEQ35016.1 hypothetical protein SAMN05421824_1424 [Hyunsoonleella jejuensis]
MEAKKINKKYVAWLSTETMHNASKKWLSELEFAKDEQLFFNDLIKSYTLQLIDSKHFNKSKDLVTQLSKVEKQTNELIETVKEHERELTIMVDGINQIELEKAYKEKHSKLIISIGEFLNNYRTLKRELFTMVKGVIKDKKQKKLLQ